MNEPGLQVSQQSREGLARQHGQFEHANDGDAGHGSNQKHLYSIKEHKHTSPVTKKLIGYLSLTDPLFLCIDIGLHRSRFISCMTLFFDD
jgi:hypothetical protein